MKKINFIVYRYLFIFLIGLGNLFIFYLIFTPLTVYPSFLSIGLFKEATLIEGITTETCGLLKGTFLENIACVKNSILLNNTLANIVPACIAGSAYYLLIILNLSLPLSLKKRIRSLFFTISCFLLLNIIRISILAINFSESNAFNIIHKTSWYFGSTIMVGLIWFINVKIFNIKSIPIYTDFNIIINNLKDKK